MKRSKLFLILMLSILIMLMGCAGNSKKTNTSLPQPPAWYGKQPSANHVCTYGMATKASETASIDAAKADAWFNAAQMTEVYAQYLLKKYEEEAGVTDPQILALSLNVAKTVSGKRFAKVIDGDIYTELVLTSDGERFKTHVQLMIPKAEINKLLVIEVKNEDALYRQFKASQAFKELEEMNK